MRRIFNRHTLMILPAMVFVAALVWVTSFRWDDIMRFVGAAAAHDSAENLKKLLGTWGIPVELVFIFIQFIQVVLFFIPGEVTQIAAGYLFGTLWGTIYSIIGISLGALTAFMLTRLFGQPFVERIFKKENVEKMELFISSPKAKIAYFIFFAVPALPKDIMCYVAGLSKLNPLTFMLISGIARLPALIVSVLIGSALSSHQITLAIVISAITIVIFVVAMIFRKKLQSLIESLLRRHQPTKTDDSTSANPDTKAK